MILKNLSFLKESALISSDDDFDLLFYTGQYIPTLQPTFIPSLFINSVNIYSVPIVNQALYWMIQKQIFSPCRHTAWEVEAGWEVREGLRGGSTWAVIPLHSPHYFLYLYSSLFFTHPHPSNHNQVWCVSSLKTFDYPRYLCSFSLNYSTSPFYDIFST